MLLGKLIDKTDLNINLFKIEFFLKPDLYEE